MSYKFTLDHTLDIKDIHDIISIDIVPNTIVNLEADYVNINGDVKINGTCLTFYLEEQEFDELIPMDITLPKNSDFAEIKAEIVNFDYTVVNRKSLTLKLEIILNGYIFEEKTLREETDSSKTKEVLDAEVEEVMDAKIEELRDESNFENESAMLEESVSVEIVEEPIMEVEHDLSEVMHVDGTEEVVNVIDEDDVYDSVAGQFADGECVIKMIYVRDESETLQGILDKYEISQDNVWNLTSFAGGVAVGDCVMIKYAKPI